VDEREIEDRADAFALTTLPVGEWTHAAHVTTALVYVRRYGREGGRVLFGIALRRYLAAVGGHPSAYHETITRAWVEVIAAFDAERPGAPLADVARELVERCGRKDYLHRHYSPGRLASDEARAGWLEPDRAPIGSG
jgi:hypothetical protein